MRDREGTGFFSVLAIVFVILKLVGVINWSWWWVLSPLWIKVILVFVIVLAGILYANHIDKKWEDYYK